MKNDEEEEGGTARLWGHPRNFSPRLAYPALVPTASPVPRRSLRAFGILFPLWLVVFTSASQTIIVTPILPIIGEALDIADAWRGSLVSVYSWVLALAALVMGPISDRIGRRLVLLIGSGTLAAVLALHGLVETFGGLLAMRALAGAAGGMLSGAAVSYVGDAFPYARRGWATGWVMSGVPFGLVLGIPLGRVLAASTSFRVPFLAFAGTMVVAFALVWAVVPQPDVERDTSRMSLVGTLVRYRDLLRLGPVRAAAATYFLMYAGLVLLITYFPQWLTENFALRLEAFGRPLGVEGFEVDFIAALYAAGGAASVVMGPYAGRLSDRLGRKPLILASCAGLAVVTAAVTYLVTARWLAFLVYVVIMLLFAMRMTPLQALLTALVADRLRGTLFSLTIAVGQIGTGLGAALAGFLYSGLGYRASTWASAATIVALGWVVWRHLPEPAEQRVTSNECSAHS